MPTGYTAAIADGIPLRQFILSCARAMGACLMQRDDPIRDLPKKMEPSTYHSAEILRAQTALQEVTEMSNEVADQKAAQDYNAEVSRITKNIEERVTLKRKYEIMLLQVMGWKPPTADHKGLKDFMVKQIQDSIEFDCDIEFYKNMLKEVVPCDGVSWRHKELSAIRRNLAYHQGQYKDELKRCKEQNAWIDALYASLPADTSEGAQV